MSLLWKMFFRKEQELPLGSVYQYQFEELDVGCQTKGVLFLFFPSLQLRIEDEV